MKKLFQINLIKRFGILSFSLVISLIIFMGIAIIYAAWTEPSVAPPGGNVGAPINVSTSTQYKSGALGVGGLFTADNSVYLATWSGNVGIGTTNPGSPLTVRRSTAGTAFAVRNTGDTANTFTISNTGSAYMTGFKLGTTATAGQVLTTNASGVGTWQAAAGGGDITAVTAGTGLTGGGTSGDVTINLATNRKGRVVTPGFNTCPAGFVVSFSMGIADCPSGQYVCGIEITNMSIGNECRWDLYPRCCGK